MIDVSYKIVNVDGRPPSYAHHNDAGMDLHNVDKRMLIDPGECVAVSTGIAFNIPANHFIMLTPKSGLALKHRITLQNAPAIIDSGYVGEIKVLLRNEGREPYVVEPFQKICQAIVFSLPSVKLWKTDTLKKTERGANGFGSTGK